MNSSTSSSRDRPAGLRLGYLLWYATTGALLVMGLAAVNWLVDPLQFYRRASYAPVFSDNQRYQNPGLARHYDYSTVVVGTSHAENFLPSQVQRVLGERSLKLAISGSTAREQLLILEVAIATGRVRHVIWALDHIAFKKPAGAVGSRSAEFPQHLYREGPETVLLYVLSLDSLALSLDALLGRGHRDLETLNAWHADAEFSERRVLADWRRRGAILDGINRGSGPGYQSTSSRSRRSIAANLIPLIEAHPEIRFDLFFPPYSILSYLADFRMWEGAFADRQAYKALIVSATARYPNVRVYDFQAVQEITHELDNYKDLEHHRLEVNQYILESLAIERHLVGPDTYHEVLGEQARQVTAYRADVCRADSPRRMLCPRVARRGEP